MEAVTKLATTRNHDGGAHQCLGRRSDHSGSEFAQTRPLQIDQRVKTTQGSLATLTPRQEDLMTTVMQLQRQVYQLQERVEDAEGRPRRNNMRIGT
ncbi:hypothetical protein NDU88_004783 [Pleurodeles waltl]|uniref:Uncharacterized protein n=1 Tax=Pleurodeles waltl TaxID=8319 RepID=A0AAV7SJW2_PLEWA|nr:hypothetical protein NDU88_004783 [Pleurodeles waltl]